MGEEMNTTWIKGIAILLFIAAIVGTTWFASKAHYIGQFDALKAEIQQQAKDEQKANDAIITKDNYVTKEAYNEAQSQLANSSNTINDLNSRLQHNSTIITSSMPTTGCSTNKPNTVSNGPGTDSGKGKPSEVNQSTSTLETETLRDALQTGIDALNAELIWRDWNRGVSK